MGVDQFYEDFEREQEEIESACARGELTEQQRNAELRLLNQEFADMEDYRS